MEAAAGGIARDGQACAGVLTFPEAGFRYEEGLVVVMRPNADDAGIRGVIGRVTDALGAAGELGGSINCDDGSTDVEAMLARLLASDAYESARCHRDAAWRSSAASAPVASAMPRASPDHP